jgi:nitrite reductase/ring-hydroxylating ferredoxin subunit
MSEPEGYKKVADLHDIPPGSMIKVQGLDIVETCILNQEGKLYALSNICTHKGGRLSEGFMRRDCVVCPWHNANFRITDGKSTWPAPEAVRSFPVRVVGNSVYVKTLNNQV